MLLSLTGDFAMFGEQAKKGALVAADEIEEQTGMPVELVFEDDKCLPGDAVTGFHKLKTIDGIGIVVGPGCTGGIMAVAPLARAAKIPQLALYDTNDEVKKAGDNTFSLGFTAEREGESVAVEMRHRGHAKVAVLYETDAWAMIIKSAFSKKFKELGGRVVFDETQSPTDKDWRPNLTKLKGRNPDSIYIVPAYNGGPVLKQIAQLQLKLPIFGPDTFGTPEVIETAGRDAEGVIFANVLIDETSKPAQHFKDRFQKKFNELPRTFFHCALGYDSVHMAYQALQDPAGALAGLKALDYHDSLLGVSRFDAARMSDVPLTLWIIRGGKFVKLSSTVDSKQE